MDYDNWAQTVPEDINITQDPLWTATAYRYALFLGDLAWSDVTALMRDARTRALSDQLYRAVGSVSSNIAEGYSRHSGKDRARFYEYSLGSARESRDWYFKARFTLGEKTSRHRIQFLTQIIRLLLTMVPQQREYVLREQAATYCLPETAADSECDQVDETSCLLADAPMPELQDGQT